MPTCLTDITCPIPAGLGIPLATLDTQPVLDVAIDGADEVDPKLDVVKGRGGALLREKMVEMASKKFVCIVDETKLVSGLGGSKGEGARVCVWRGICWLRRQLRVAQHPCTPLLTKYPLIHPSPAPRRCHAC
jgi:hypothetical protein